MIFDNAIEQARSAASKAQPVIKLADVTSVSNGKALVNFYGETVASTKYFAYIVGYKPTVGDKVALLAVGNSYIILGKVSTDNITNNYYPTAAEVANTYETQSHASSTYETASHALSTYLSKSDAQSTYLKQTDASSTYLSKSDAQSTYLKQTDASSTYLSKTDASSTYLKKTDASNTYLTQSTADGRYRGINSPFSSITNGTRSFSIDSQNEISGDYITLGKTGHAFPYVNTSDLRVTTIRYTNSSASGGLRFENQILYPVYNNDFSLGQSGNQFLNIRGKNIYVDGSPISTSDRRLKKSIKTLGRRWLDFFYRLRPTSFKYKDGTSGRTHTGFIAQEVEEAAKDAGIERQDIAAIVVDEDGRYYLRYEELIAVQTLAIHDLQDQIDDLRTRLDSLERALKK